MSHAATIHPIDFIVPPMQASSLEFSQQITAPAATQENTIEALDGSQMTYAAPSGTAWSRINGEAIDVGVSPEGAVWVTGTDERIYLRNVQNGVDNSNPPDGDFNDSSDVPQRNDWVPSDGFAVNISVGVDAQPWVVASNTSIWRRR